jgi:hypothetical protein
MAGNAPDGCRDRRLLARLTNAQLRAMISRATYAAHRSGLSRISAGRRFMWERVLLRLNSEAFRRVDAGRWGDNPLAVK